jgi:hypothetical protein
VHWQPRLCALLPVHYDNGEAAGVGDGLCSAFSVALTSGLLALLDVQALMAAQHTATRVSLEIRLRLDFIEQAPAFKIDHE